MHEVLKLYPAQEEGVARFVASSRRRLLLAYGTGCGKTATAIRAVLQKTAINKTLHLDTRVLVICPAIVRRHWIREFKRWGGVEAHSVEMSRARKTGSKKALRERDAAYAANIQVVSYDLLGEIRRDGWDGILLDEVHHLSDCTSKQSRAVRALFAANPGVAALGLSATLIPTELWQLWHPLYLLFGREWGLPPKSGKICWDFVGRYCHLERTEYGTKVGRPRDSRKSELRNRLEKVAHIVSREDIADDLPPIDCRTLEVPGTALSREGAELRHAIEWYRELPPDIHHVVILTYHRDVARSIFMTLQSQHGAPARLIDGSMGTSERVALLDECENMHRCVLVATSESIREGVRLMWAQKVLFAEWRQSPVKVTQTLGRFQSIGDRRRPQIEVLTDESLYGAAKVLTDRVKVITQALRGSSAERTVEEVFAPRDLTDERLETLTRHMLADFRTTDDQWAEETEEEAHDW